MTNTVSVEIDLAREIYERLRSQGWLETEEFWTKKESQSSTFKVCSPESNKSIESIE